MSVFICVKVSVFVFLSVSMSVWSCGFVLCVIPQFYLSLAAEDLESYEGMRGGWWWRDVSGGESAGAAWSMMVRGFRSPPPPFSQSSATLSLG